MSSSPQISKPDTSGGDLALRTVSSGTTTTTTSSSSSSSSPPPLPPSSMQSLLSSSSQSKLNNCSYPYFNNRTTSSSSIELQEETILEKQTVRISPSLHKKAVAIPITTYFLNGQQQLHHYQHQQKQQQRRIIAANGPRVSQEDKGCQTEDFLQNMDNRVNGIVGMVNGNSSDDQQPNYHLYPKVINHKYGTAAASVVDRRNGTETCNKEFLSSQTADTDSKDRELEHIDIVISESKYVSDNLSSSSSNDVVDVAAIHTQPKQNGSVHPANLNELKSIDDFHHEKRRPPLKDEEEDTCCMNCFLITLNICDCVIL